MPASAQARPDALRFAGAERIRNSPTKPLSAGRPIDESAMMRKKRAKIGISPRQAAELVELRVWRRS